MKDERRLCGNCKHEHAWGILRYSPDGVPLYGARRCKVELGEQAGTYQGYLCGCTQFVAAIEGEENLPALTNDQTKALWSRTSFMNSQVPAATRIAVDAIMQLVETASMNYDPALGGAAREFMGLMLSQITDIRSALTKDDNKFAHLVAHTDEIVEAMKGVVQLKERLDTIYATQERILERLDGFSRLSGDTCVTCGHPVAVHTVKVDITNQYAGPPHSDGCSLCPCTDLVSRASVKEAAHVFDSKSAPLWREPIVTSTEPDDE